MKKFRSFTLSSQVVLSIIQKLVLDDASTPVDPDTQKRSK